jgi:hypothetical protein
MSGIQAENHEMKKESYERKDAGAKRLSSTIVST